MPEILEIDLHFKRATRRHCNQRKSWARYLANGIKKIYRLIATLSLVNELFKTTLRTFTVLSVEFSIRDIFQRARRGRGLPTRSISTRLCGWQPSQHRTRLVFAVQRRSVGEQIKSTSDAIRWSCIALQTYRWCAERACNGKERLITICIYRKYPPEDYYENYAPVSVLML